MHTSNFAVHSLPAHDTENQGMGSLFCHPLHQPIGNLLAILGLEFLKLEKYCRDRLTSSGTTTLNILYRGFSPGNALAILMSVLKSGL